MVNSWTEPQSFSLEPRAGREEGDWSGKTLGTWLQPLPWGKAPLSGFQNCLPALPFRPGPWVPPQPFLADVLKPWKETLS